MSSPRETTETTGGAPGEPALLARVEGEGRSLLLEPEVYALLAGAGIEVPTHRFVPSPEEVEAALEPGLPGHEVVVKLASPDVLHKSDLGGVVFCPNSPRAVRGAVAKVLEAARRARPQADLRGALVAERIRYRAGLGREVLAGFRHDPAFGPVVLLGPGGLDTEVLLGAIKPERALRAWAAEELTEDAALAGLRGTLVHEALCRGLRSGEGPTLPDERLARFVLALAALARRLAGFEPPGGLGLGELELNPVVMSEDGRLVALDALARLHRPGPRSPARPLARLSALLTPRSAVVVGASAAEVNVGRIILRNLAAGGGVPRDRIRVVHPRADAIDGCRAIRSLAELEEPVDLAVVAVPAEHGAESVLRELVAGRHARSVTLIPGGFGETEAGRVIEARLRAAIEESHRDPDGGVVVNGGNCLGILSEPGGYSTFFIPSEKLPLLDAPGRNVAAISQSGAQLVSQISNLAGVVRPRYAVSLGNQVDLTLADYLEFLEADLAVRVFAVYLEGFRPGDGARFLRIARRLSDEGRPVLLYKAGRTPEGRNAAASHTAAAVGDHEVSRELVRAAGVIDCDTLQDFDDAVMTFSLLTGRLTAGRRVAVLSNAGFECTVAADTLRGLQPADLLPGTRRRLRDLLPGVVDVHNPVDTTPTTSTERYAECALALLADRGVDALVVAGVPATPALETLAPGEGHREDIGRESSLPSHLIRLFHASDKPVVFSVDAGPLYDPCARMMLRAGLPCFRRVDRAVRALDVFLGVEPPRPLRPPR